MTASSTNFAPFMEAVARELLGEPNARMSSKSELRFGTNGSMSVDVDAGTYYDHQAKEGGGVLDLIERETGKKNGGGVEWLRDHGFHVSDDRAPLASDSNKRANPAKIVKTYDYLDETGDLVFQVCRMEPKSFRQRRKPLPTDDKASIKRDRDGQEWVWSVKGVRMVPYRLPEVLEEIANDRVVFIVEGEKDADNLWNIGVPATTAAMGAGKWPEGLNEFFRGARVVILPDNDEAGRDHRNLVGASLQATAAEIRALDLPGLPEKGDVSDWLKQGGTPEKLFDLVERESLPFGQEKAKLHFGSVWFADTEKSLGEPEWLIDDLLTRGDTSLVFGPSQSGKSFLATHLALSIARGEPVFERKVSRGGVIYIAAEGQKGFKKRLKAYRMHFNLAFDTALPFVLVPAAVDLFSKEGDIDKLLTDIAVIKAEMAARFGVKMALTVVDTHAAVSPGANENASEDVSRIIQNYTRLRESTEGAMMIVHHKNANGERPRGHTSLFAGVDNAIEVNCDEHRNRTLKVDKMKDGEAGFSIGFQLKVVEIGTRDDGKSITSCVVEPANAPAQRPSNRKNRLSSDQAQIALNALRLALGDHGETAPSALNLPYGVKVVRAEWWKKKFLEMAFDEEPNESTFRSALKRVGDKLLADGIVGRNAPYLWIVREPSR